MFRSIKDRLITATVLTCGTVLLLVFAILAVAEHQSAHRTIGANLSTIANIVGHNIVDAIAFEDSDYAEEILLALRAEPEIEYAHIHLADGSIFATYDRENSERRQTALDEGAHGAERDLPIVGSFKLLLFADYIDIVETVYFDNMVNGHSSSRRKVLRTAPRR